MVSVQAQIEIKGDLSLASISRELVHVNISGKILKSALIKLQDELVLDLCGPKYERKPHREIVRAGTTSRALWTMHGKIEFKLARVYDLRNEGYFRPLLVYIGVLPKQRIIDDLVLECAEIATYLTFRDSKTVVENLTVQRFPGVEFMIACRK